jgi:outer membrane cobalamin receptor
VNTYFADDFADEANVKMFGEGEDIDVTITGLGSDPVALFDVTIPINERATKVKGWEMVIQHTFNSGLGFQANYTIVDGSLEYDINLNEKQ